MSRTSSGRGLSAATLLFAATLLVSSSLLFVVEPMFAKMVLPRLGGTPAVWNTCVVFFQAAMLAGYAYAHLTSRRLRLAQQVVLHSALMLATAFLLSVVIPDDWIPPAEGTLGAVARELGLVARVRSDTRTESDARSSVWLVMARSDASLGGLADDGRWAPAEPGTMAVWTDDYSNLLSVIERPRFGLP